MKTMASLIAGGLFLLSQALPVGAQTTTFSVSATIPTATGISITVSKVNSTTNVFTVEPPGFTNLSMDPMTFNTTNNVYLPDHYWAIDYAASGGSGEPDLTFTYTEGTNPNGSSNGLGTKTSATIAKEVVSGSTTTETVISKQTLGSMSATHFPFTDFTGGFARSYIAVCTGNTSTDPASCHPFTNADASGAYNGSLAVTAVVN